MSRHPYRPLGERRTRRDWRVVDCSHLSGIDRPRSSAELGLSNYGVYCKYLALLMLSHQSINQTIRPFVLGYSKLKNKFHFWSNRVSKNACMYCDSFHIGKADGFIKSHLLERIVWDWAFRTTRDYCTPAGGSVFEFAAASEGAHHHVGTEKRDVGVPKMRCVL